MTQPITGPKHPVLIFLCANLVYLVCVHAWALRGPILPFELLCRGLLLYGCMVGVFFLTRAVVKGPWWLGSLAAVLMMANPLKTEAILVLPAATALVPALATIWGMLLLTWCAGRLSAKWPLFPFLVSALLLPWFPGGLLALSTAGNAHAPKSYTTTLTLILAASVLALATVRTSSIGLAPALLTLFLAVYPIGLTAETMAFIQSGPWIAWGLAALVAVAWVLLWLVSGQTAVLLCGVAALAITAQSAPVDLASMQGGGLLMVPIALVAIGFAAICRRVMTHPQWPRHVVFLTTLLCLAFFVLQIRAIGDFNRAAVSATVETVR